MKRSNIFLTAAAALALVACSDNSNSNSNNPSGPSGQATYVAEIGNICVDFNLDAVTRSNATEAYVAMTQICGNMATGGTGATCYSADAVTAWLNDLNLNDIIPQVNADVSAYGSSFQWYNAVDGYLRYVYVEPCGDGVGLLKKAEESK